MRQQYRETFDTGEIATGGGNDTGIDAIAILVNGQLVSDIDELTDVAAGGTAFASYRLEFLFRNQRLDPQYKPARFHLLLAARLLISSEGLPPSNSRAMERYSSNITSILWDIEKSDVIFTKATEVVSKVAQGDFDRDKIRTQPFTQGVIDACRNAVSGGNAA